MEDVPLQRRVNILIQQDGEPPHYGQEVKDFLNQNYPSRWIGRQGLIAWPPRSPDLTPLDFYLWGHMKSLVFTVSPINEEDLVNKIIDAATAIKNDHCVIHNAMQAILERSRLCIDVGGGHFEQLM